MLLIFSFPFIKPLRSNIVATKSLSSPFGYNDCDDAALYPGQPSSSSHTHDGQGQGPNVAGNTQQNLNSSNNYGSQYNQFNQYPLPMPPLPPNISAPHPNTVIGKISSCILVSYRVLFPVKYAQ